MPSAEPQVDRAATVKQSRPVSLRRRLLAIALAGILPLAAIAALGLAEIIRGQREATERRVLEVTRLAATAIEVELGRSHSVLLALAQSPLLDQQDFTAFGELIRRVLASAPSWHTVVVAAPDGRVIMRVARDGRITSNTLRLADPASFERVLATRKPQIGLLSQGADGIWGVPLRVPAERDGEVRYVVSASVNPASIMDVINTRRLPASWVTTVLDTNGHRVARSLHNRQTLGQPPSPSLAKLLGERRQAEGTGVADTIEGVRTYAAFVRLQSAGWVVATGIPTREVEAAAAKAFLIYGGGLLLSLALAIAAARLSAVRISAPMRQLRLAAQALGNAEPPDLPESDIHEIQAVSRALGDAVAARRYSESERDEVLRRLELTQEELTQQVADLQTLQLLNQQLLELPTLEAQLGAILDVLCQFHAADHGLVSLLDGRKPLRIAAARGYAADTIAQLNQLLPTEASTFCLSTERLVIADTETDPRYTDYVGLARAEGFRAVHHVPLRSSSGSVLGALSVELAQPREPTTRECRLADVCAALAAVFIERERARSEAGESEYRLRVALDSSTVPFCIISPVSSLHGPIRDFRCDFVNPIAASTLKLPVQRLLGARLRPLIRRVDRGAVFRLCVEVVTRQQSGEAELSLLVDGGERWFTIVATPFQHSVAIWFSDITERKRQQSLLQEADRRKDDFLATLAHELRNPLAPIRQAAAIAGSADASEAQKRWSSDIIERQVQHMVLLLDDLLDISRITLGKLTLRRQRVDLQQVVEAALETTRPMLEARGHRIQVAMPAQPIPLLADPLRLEQIFSNLLTNANKFTGPGGNIRIDVTLEEEQVAVVVADDGAGIAARDLDSIFQMFTQLAPSGEGNATGLGIGLALARGLAQLHGGNITVASAGLGCGSRFTVTLPRACPEAGAAAPLPRRHGRAAGLRILVADDNRDNARTLAELLRLEGHEVELAFDGEEALDGYRQQRPEVVLLDIGMPRRRGDEVARAIRAMPEGEAVLLVAITGWGQDRDKAEALAAGFNHHLTKPVDIGELLAIVSRVGSCA